VQHAIVRELAGVFAYGGVRSCTQLTVLRSIRRELVDGGRQEADGEHRRGSGVVDGLKIKKTELQ